VNRPQLTGLLPSTTAAAALLAGALFLSATGGAVAGSMITGKQIKDGSVTGKDLKDRSVSPADLAPGTVTAGPAGAPGASGTPGLSGVQLIVATKTGIANGASGNLLVECPAGKVVISSEAEWGSTNEALMFSRPGANLSRTFVFYTNDGGSTDSITATALCATVG
jgi:hypothetical protein